MALRTLLPTRRPLTDAEQMLDAEIDRFARELATFLMHLDNRNFGKSRQAEQNLSGGLLDAALAGAAESDRFLTLARQQLTDGLLSARHSLYSVIESV